MMMRKLLPLLLSLALLFSAAGALAEETGGTESINIISLTAAGGEFYALNYVTGGLALVRYTPQTRAMETLGKVADSSMCVDEAQVEALLTDELPVALSALFSDGTTLYGLCTPTGTAYTLLDESGAFAPAALPVKLDISGMIIVEENVPYTLGISSLFAQDGLLCYQLQNTMATPRYRLGAIDLATGAKLDYSIEHSNSLCAYEGGKALVTILDPTMIFDAEAGTTTQSMDLGTLDLRTGAYEKLGELSGDGDYGIMTFNGMCYASGSIFYVLNGKVFGYDIASGVTRIAAYTGEGLIGGLTMRAFACMPGYYAQGGSNMLSSFALDTDAVKRGALTIFGEFGGDAHKSFAKNYPDIPTTVAGNYQSDLESLTTAMVSGGDTYDVLLLSINYMPVPKLIAKGYCSDLSGYPEIMSHLEGMDPRFRDVAMVDGGLYGVPVSTDSLSYGVFMEKWESIGLTEDDLPKTVPELFDFIANWDYDYADDYPDIHLFDFGGTKSTLFSLMLHDYIYYCQSQNMELTFNTPVWRGLLDSLEAIDFSIMDEQESETFHTGGSLFVMYATPTRLDLYNQIGFMPLPLALADGLDPVIGVNTSVLVLNPRSQRKEDALRYIANYVDNISANDRIVMFPDSNEPEEDPLYPLMIEEYDRMLASKRAALDRADASEKAALQSELTQLEENRVTIEKRRYRITEEYIAFYRERIAPYTIAAHNSALLAGDSQASLEIQKLLTQYIDGAIDQEQLIKDLDQRLWMMRMEDQ